MISFPGISLARELQLRELDGSEQEGEIWNELGIWKLSNTFFRFPGGIAYYGQPPICVQTQNCVPLSWVFQFSVYFFVGSEAKNRKNNRKGVKCFFFLFDCRFTIQ
jgi:hypothetical protein